MKKIKQYTYEYPADKQDSDTINSFTILKFLQEINKIKDIPKDIPKDISKKIN